MAVVLVGSHSLLLLGLGKRRRRRRAPPLRPFRPSSEFIISNHSPPSFLLPPHSSLPQHPKLFFGSDGGPSSSSLHHRLKPIPALDSEAFAHDHQKSVTRNSGLEQWDALTAKFAGAANLPFLLLQIPQIVLNARNLLAGNKTALLAVPWLGMFTGLLGNLSLLSYFAKKKEKEAVVVQTLGVISIYVVIAQLAMAEAMPLPHFIATSIVVASGLALNFLNYFDLLSAGIWRFWEDFITVAGLSVLPQRIRIEGIKNDPWFRKNYVAVEHGGDEDVNLDNVHTVFDDIEEQHVTEQSENNDSGPFIMNAFEMITLSQGLNLSALFDRRQDYVKRQTRFISCQPAKAIISAVEAVAESMGLKTRLEGMSVNKIGQFAVVLEVFEVAPFLFMVDVRKATGDTNEYQMFYKNFCAKLEHIIWKPKNGPVKSSA